MAAQAVMIFTAGCVPVPHANPAFPLTTEQASRELERMRADPRPLERPVVVLAGYRDPGVWAGPLAGELADLTNKDRSDFLSLSYPFLDREEALVSFIVEQVEQRWASASASETVAVDVIGISMGGLVARAAALPVAPGDNGVPSRKRLRLVRLFTLASPHRGAKLARVLAPDEMAQNMRSGSDFLREIDEHYRSGAYEVIPYARLRDGIVGATNTAPPGQQPIWIAGTLVGSHMTIQDDVRVIADIVARLRGEPPFGRPSEPVSD